MQVKFSPYWYYGPGTFVPWLALSLGVQKILNFLHVEL